MNGKHVVWGLAVAVGLLAGCDREEAQPGNPAPVSPTPPAPDVTPKTGDDAADGAGTATSGANVPGDDEAGASTTTDPKTAAAEDDAATAKVRQATEHLSKTAQHLKDQKPDLARKSLEQAEAMKDELPETLRAQIKTMRANVDSFARSETQSPGQAAPLPDEENK